MDAPGDPKFPIARPRTRSASWIFEGLARTEVPPAHWVFMASVVDYNADAQTANISAFLAHVLRPAPSGGRRQFDQSVRFVRREMGEPLSYARWECSYVSSFNPDCEVGTARPRAAKAKNTFADSFRLDFDSGRRVAKRVNAPWYQLYMPQVEDLRKLTPSRKRWLPGSGPGHRQTWLAEIWKQSEAVRARTRARSWIARVARGAFQSTDAAGWVAVPSSERLVGVVISFVSTPK